ITFLQTFDRAVAEPNCTRRSSATVVSQALAMLNSRFANATAERFAARLMREAPAGREDRIRRAFLISYSRLPGETDQSRISGFLASQTARYREGGASEPEAAMSALVDFCQVLLASNEFLYVR